ncbi:serine/threonine-protein kinase PknK [Sandaracinus amylolyticus]|uniref:non-specific serine/threonine protein kinase n=1 Tax=Sandaracinus amylolyticus TaxID=927083 RepID=A0A0F6VZL8_9BACT|nr:serine/threonine-protein kinase [Sandaracinus amylolyticus]AKF03527.1 serine/threonine protein kinase [Sandaracinus amylolyticus]
MQRDGASIAHVLRSVTGADGRFEIEQKLGAGAYASVFRAFDRAQRTRVALKVPHELDAHALLALKDEFRTLASVSHPNVVAFHELFVRDGACFFTMQLVRGVDVLTHVERHGRESAREVLAGLTAGLAALHESGIVHRDLKPSNAWVDARGTPVLLDFGLALADASLAARAAPAGTPAYVAPELMRGRAPSPKSDLYALGVLGFEMLTGRRPFEGHATAILASKLMQRAPGVREVAPHVDAELASAIDALLDPDPETRPDARELTARLAQRVAQPSLAVARTFVGRAGLASELAAALARADRGTPVVRFLRGPAGIGKSTLLDRVLARVDAATTLVLRGRCSEHETVPYATLDAVLDALARRLASDDALRDELHDLGDVIALVEAFPVFRSVLDAADAPASRQAPLDPSERRRRIGAALASLLRQIAARRTVVIAIDDLQWADEDGARLLHDALTALGAARVCVIAAHRDEARGPALAHLASLDVATIDVPPLDAIEAAALADALGIDPSRHAREVARSGGSPFLLEALALAGGDDDATDPDQLARAALRRRIATLDPGARAMVETLCIAGHPLSPELVAAAAGTRADVGVLRALTTSRLARSRPGADGASEIEPYHDRVREIVADELEASRRREVHRALARVLEARPGIDPVWICRHLEGAGELERAASFAESGAHRAAQALAFARAAELYRFAIAHRAEDDDHTRTLRVALGDALAHAGRGRDAASAYLDAERGERDPDRRLDLRRRAAEQLLRSGFFAEGTALLDEVLALSGVVVRRSPMHAIATLIANRVRILRHGLAPSAERTPDPAELRRIDACMSGAVGLSVVDSIRSADLMSEALHRTLAIGDRRRLAATLSWHVAFLANEAGPAEAHTRAVLAHARALTEAHGDAYARGCFEAASALTEFHLGHNARARAHCERAEAIFARETIGTAKEIATAQTFANATLAIEGRLDALAHRLAEHERVAEQRGERYALTNHRQGLMILRWLAADDPRRAHADLDAAMDGFGARGFVVQSWFDLWGRVAVALYEGRARDARALYARTRGRLVRSLLARTQWTRAHMLVMDATTSIAIGSPPRLAWARLVIAQLARESRPWTGALASMLSACVAAKQDHERALARLGDTIDALDRAELGLWSAAARIALAPHDARHRAAAREWAERERVRAPARLASMLLPGVRIS